MRLLGEMPQEDLHAALKNCFAVVNSSMSEGMSAAILEVRPQRKPPTWSREAAAPPSPICRGVLVHQGLRHSEPWKKQLSWEPQK